MLTVTTSFVDGQLSIASDWDDNLVLSVDQGYVKVNGLDPIEGVVAAADVTGLSIRGGLLSKLIDASGTNGHLAISGVSVTMPRISEYVADLYEDTPLESQLMAAFDSGLLTEEDVARVTMGYVDADLLDRLAQVGVSQDLIDKGLEALEFFHPEFENPLDDFHAGQARQMLAATSENDDPVVYGTTGNDILNGGEGNQTFYGGQGSDQIDGGEGNDVIYGGSGNDFLDGGEGKSGFYSGPSDDDTMYGGDGFDTWADGGEGSDVFVQDGPNFDFVYPEPIVTISDPSVVESAASMTFTVTLNNSYSDIVSIPWSTADGSATAPNDYTASSGTLVFAVGETQRGISIPIINDTDNENDETLSVVLGTPTNATIGDGIGVGTIYDNDTPVGSMPSASISTAGNVEEGYGGAAFEITLSQAINKTVRVHYATGGGTAIAGTHYTSVSADVYFAPNETSKIVTVQWNDDDMYEGHLDAPYFFVTLSSPLNATIGTASGYAIIIDDDPLPTLSINDITVTEADPGQPVYATFTVSLSNPIALVVTATVVTGPGTALYLSDYSLPTSANLTIPAGQTSAQFSVAIVTNLVPEPTEYFYATITEANVVVSDSQGIAVIIDNDPLPALSISDVTVNEAVGQAQFFVTRTGAIDVPISVEWYTEEGSA
ncbi:MAG: Calx-beta domain-containing protein, partial [Pirellulales bacterium]